MNNSRRDILKLAIKSLESASCLASQALDKEQDCFDNIPENLQESERYQKMESAIEKLEEAIEQIDAAKENIEEASE